MGRTESRHGWQTGRRDAWLNGSPQMRQSAGKKSENAASTKRRGALAAAVLVLVSVVRTNHAAIVAPTLARSTPVARASSTLLLKTASCTRARLEVRACQCPKYNGLGGHCATHQRPATGR